MSLLFYLTGREGFDIKEFCRQKDNLTYIGEFANKETSKVLLGTIIQYDGKFYSTEEYLHVGLSYSARKQGMVTTSLELFETDYVPEKSKPIGDCPILIDIWDIHTDNEVPIGSYAFYNSQMEEAKEVVKNHSDVDIFINGVKKERNDFLES